MISIIFILHSLSTLMFVDIISSYSLECKLMLFVTKHVPFLIFEAFQIFSNSFIHFYSCKVVSLSDRGNKKAKSFPPIMAVVAKCLHFVMSYMKQNRKRKQTFESA